MKKLILSLLIIASIPSTVFGWGQKGHDVIANIAEKHLSKNAKIAVDSILDGKSLVYYSNWLDNASHTPEYAYTKTWHYKNIDAGQNYEDAPNHPNGNVITGLNSQILLLQSGTLSKEESALALKIIIHLVGDLHQPMHMGHLSDLGGNKWSVKYFNRTNNIHSIWDSSLVESAHKWSYTEWTDQIDRVNEEAARQISEGTFDDWGKETFQICTEIYETTPVDYNVSYDYIAKWTPTIENQFLKGGYRLAKILNLIFDNENIAKCPIHNIECE